MYYTCPPNPHVLITINKTSYFCFTRQDLPCNVNLNGFLANCIMQMDIAAEEAVRQAEAHIRAINSSVPIVHTHRCRVDLKLILDR